MLYSVERYDPDTKSWGWLEEEDFNTLAEALYQIACMTEMDIKQNEYIPNRYRIEVSD